MNHNNAGNINARMETPMIASIYLKLLLRFMTRQNLHYFYLQEAKEVFLF
jgi:hypothetical protein